MVFTELFFAFYNGYSGQIYFAEWLPLLFNAFWTSWPCMMNFALDQDANADSSIEFPKLYKAGPSGRYFNFKTTRKNTSIKISNNQKQRTKESNAQPEDGSQELL